MRYARYALAAALLVAPLVAQDVQPTNDAPNPYTTVKDYFKLPEGRAWGSTSAVEIDRDGRSIWVAERCGQNGCLDRATGKMSDAPSVLKFDSNGTLVWQRSWGGSAFEEGEALAVAADGSIYVVGGTSSFGSGSSNLFALKFAADGKKRLVFILLCGDSSRTGRRRGGCDRFQVVFEAVQTDLVVTLLDDHQMAG